MAITEEQKQKDMEDYASAFDEDMQPTETDDMTDGGTNSAETPDSGSVTAEPEQAEAMTEEAPVEEAPAEEVPEPVESEGGEMASAEPAPEEMPTEEPAGELSDVPPEDMQRYKSWEGRLKKREAELAAREAALAESGSPAQEEAGEMMQEEASEPGQTGSFDELTARFAEDFGEEFASLFKAAVEAGVKEHVANLVGDTPAKVQEAIDALNGRFEEADQSSHFDYILDKHEDFFDVTGSDEFKSWVSDKPEMQECCAHGNKRAVVKMLSAFKESQKEAENDEGLDDLVVVQSSGLTIPDTKKKTGDFEGAWNEF